MGRIVKRVLLEAAETLRSDRAFKAWHESELIQELWALPTEPKNGYFRFAAAEIAESLAYEGTVVK
jgi:hypothetical protein